MRRQKSIFENIDWLLVSMYLVFLAMGWFNIYAAVYNEEHRSIFDISENYGKQMIWIGTALIIAIAILIIDGKFYAAFSYPIYGVVMFLLLIVLVVARDIKGAVAWIDIGSFKLQPSEFAKFATNMAVAKYLSTLNIRMEDLKTKITAGLIVAIPAVIILLQNDTGSAIVFAAFIFVLYREGLTQNVLLFGFFAAVIFVLTLMVSKVTLLLAVVGIMLIAYFLLRKTRKNLIAVATITIIACGVVMSVDYAFNHVLQAHQRERIDVLIGKKSDLKGAGYNVNQSLIAIGSGGLAGKGFLQGTQTKFDFVPEQSTDFIFCTVGEEWGFAGTS